MGRDGVLWPGKGERDHGGHLIISQVVVAMIPGVLVVVDVVQALAVGVVEAVSTSSRLGR